MAGSEASKLGALHGGAPGVFMAHANWQARFLMDGKMSQIHVNAAPNRSWFWVLGVGLAAGAAGLVWWTRAQHVPEGVTAVATAPSAVVAASLPDETAPTAEEAKLIIQQQMAAKAELDKQPLVQPVKGAVTERPAYVSVLEWQLLQGVAKQHLHPAEELTRLVNSLRFTKQLERWQDLPKTADVATREALARPLLEDLPQRVKQGDMDLSGASTLQAALLADVFTDAKARDRQAVVESLRLQVAAEEAARKQGERTAVSAPP